MAQPLTNIITLKDVHSYFLKDKETSMSEKGHLHFLKHEALNPKPAWVHGVVLSNNKFSGTNLSDWLAKTPPYTTLRINTLRCINTDILYDALKEQSAEIGVQDLPKFYFVSPDCIILEKWPLNPLIQKENKEVIVDNLCGAAVLRGSHVYAPGVMGLPSDIELNDLVDVYADIEGKCKRGFKKIFEGEKKYVGTGRLKKLRHEVFDQALKPSGIAVNMLMPESQLPVINESLYPKGDVVLQNLPSLVCGWVVNAQPGETILDMCAAPGNKTTHLAEMSNDKANIIALDKTAQKVEKIKANCSIRGITCVHSYVCDSTQCYSDNSTNISYGPPFPAYSFDKILLDAPCSGLGQRPQLNLKISVKTLQSYQFVQKKLVATAVKLLKVGGTLVYSTCTINQMENENIVKWTLEKFPFMKLTVAEPLLGGPAWPECGLTDEQRICVQRFGPGVDTLRLIDNIYRESIGFFIASFIKNE